MLEAWPYALGISEHTFGFGTCVQTTKKRPRNMSEHVARVKFVINESRIFSHNDASLRLLRADHGLPHDVFVGGFDCGGIILARVKELRNPVIHVPASNLARVELTMTGVRVSSSRNHVDVNSGSCQGLETSVHVGVADWKHGFAVIFTEGKECADDSVID